jgi:hypothetical protein
MKCAVAPLLAGLLMISLGGCSKPLDDVIVGKWEGEFELSSDDSSEEGFGAALAKGMMSIFNPKLDLKEDKTFKMTIFVPIEGTWSVTRDELVLTADTFMGMTFDEDESEEASKEKNNNTPMRFRIVDEGTKLVSIEDGGAESTVFIRPSED